MITENEKFEDTLPDKLLAIELAQCVKLKALKFSYPVEFIYNPLEYAYDMHSNFVHKFCKTQKKILFLGMNPGPWGMSQTGVPFGEIPAVKEWLQISGTVGHPEREHPSRQVLGLECRRSEVSGRKFWGLFRDLCGTPEVFFQHAYVHNFCPLAFMTISGKNVTPLELKVSERRSVYEVCDEALYQVVQLLQVDFIIGVGKFAETRASLAIRGSQLEQKIKITSIPHPSPRNFSSKDWLQDARRCLEDLDLISILCSGKAEIQEQGSWSDICHYLKMMLYYTAITIYIVSSLSYVATSQKVGELCTMKNGLIGICQRLVDCSDTLNKAVNGQPPVICNFDSDLPVVCCAESVRFQPLREPASENNQRAYNREAVYRYPRQEQPWWLAENPFVENKHQTTTRKPDSSESLDSPWWLQENPFHPPESKPVVLPPTIPPSPVRQTPPPVTTRPQHPQTTREATHPQRISEIKCNEYSKLAVKQVSALPLIPSPDLIPIDVPKCDFSSLELIVGGNETSPKEFPHMAALGYKEGGNLEWRCGGSLISEYYVLTAAHCTPNKNPPIIARLGELNLKRNDDEAQPVNYAIVERIRHPDYKPPAKYSDIALLKLDRKVEFNDFIRPACLYTRSNFDVNKTVATGWGQIDFAERQSDILLKVAISIIDNKQCNDLYKMDNLRELSRGIQPTMMCAGELRGGKDTCQGDSGGPIQITRPNNQCVYNIIGVTSYGKICAAKNSLGIYTRVSAFVPWIESIVWPDQ